MFDNKGKLNIHEFKKNLDTFDLHGEEQITQIVKTKYNEEVLLYHTRELSDYLQVRLYSSVYSDRIFINLIFKDNNMIISDINILNNSISKGYGTILLDYALELAKRKKINKVDGSLFSTDENNKMRQISFYEKYGFTISDNRINLTL